MRKNFKLILISIITVISIFNLTGCKKVEENNNKLSIISTSFPGYDFARAITNDTDASVKMLIKPGSETHDFEPTPKDLINIKNSDIFIYVGGDSDDWIDDILDDIDVEKTKIIKLMDLVDTVEEEIIEGMEEDDDDEAEEAEYDEHVWTSPKNAITIVEKLSEIIKDVDNKSKDIYEENSEKYINELNSIDLEFKKIVNNSKRKEIVFGDRFPLRYFADEYGLSYYAAFPGCSDSTEANAKTISFLINKVKEDNIPVVFHIELSNKKIAKEIAKETGAKVLEFNSAHNISQKDFDSKVTYIDIMNNNIKVLKEALN